MIEIAEPFYHDIEHIKKLNDLAKKYENTDLELQISRFTMRNKYTKKIYELIKKYPKLLDTNWKDINEISNIPREIIKLIKYTDNDYGLLKWECNSIARQHNQNEIIIPYQHKTFLKQLNDNARRLFNIYKKNLSSLQDVINMLELVS